MALSRLMLAMAAVLAPSEAATKGSMSMWADTQDTLVGYKSEGSACKYADKAMGGLRAPTAQTPYIQARKYCAVNRGMFGGGEICGACYRLTFHGDQEQGLGRPGSEIIQVVDSGSWATFDCHMNAFKKITGYDTHFFPVTYERVSCDLSPGGPVAGVLEADYYFSKVVFNNLHYPVKSAAVDIGGKSYKMKLVGGWWHVWTGNVEGTVSFQITEDNGEKAQISGCFGGWENRKTGLGCSKSRHSMMLELASAAAPELVPEANSTALATDNNTVRAASNLRGGVVNSSTASVAPAGNESAAAAAAGLVYP